MSRFWQHFISNGFTTPPEPTPPTPPTPDEGEALDAFSRWSSTSPRRCGPPLSTCVPATVAAAAPVPASCSPPTASSSPTTTSSDASRSSRERKRSVSPDPLPLHGPMAAPTRQAVAKANSTTRRMRGKPRPGFWFRSWGYAFWFAGVSGMDTSRPSARSTRRPCQWTLQEFSGTLSIDEIHLGAWTLLLATDPLHDFPVAFALVSSNDQDHRGRFLRQLRDHGFHPRVVVIDGSNLSPTLLATVWPQTEHQLCVFHILQDLTGDVLEAVKRLRRQQRRRGNAGRKRRPGQAGRGTRRLTAKEKAHFVFKHRYLLVKRPEKQTVGEKQALQTMLAYLPELRVLRQFMDRVYLLLEASQTEKQSRARSEQWQAEAAFRAVPALAAVLKGMTVAKFSKVVAFLRSPLGQRVRTNLEPS